MRYVYAAILAALSIVAPAASGQTFSITNYQVVTQQAATGTQWYLTYRADVVNTGPAVGSVVATLSSNDPFSVRALPGTSTLNFAPVPANSQVTSSNTFTVLASSATLDPTKIQWTYQTTPVGPTANAGPNQPATVGSTVTLNGSASTTPSGTLSYSWKFTTRPSGTSAVLMNATSVMPSFVVDVAGTYIITLTVSNGAASSSASVWVSTILTPPVASAGSNQTLALGATALLNGAGSTNVVGNPLTYAWTITSRPANSTATLAGATTVTPSFVVDAYGAFTIQLIVSDGFANSAPSTVTITTLNSPPVAVAGPAQVVAVGTTVQLDGSKSVDFDGNPLTYQWSLIRTPAGSHAQLSSTTVVNPTFTVDVAGTYIAQLIVNDGVYLSYPTATAISTTLVLPPTANAGSNQTVTPGTVVTLNGSGTDPQALQLTFQWSLITLPANSHASLSSSTIANPTFSADVPGVYVAQLIVNNGKLSSSPATVMITSTTLQPPTANAGGNQGVTPGTVVSLHGSGTDPQSLPLTFHWSLTSLPANSSATLSNPTTANPTFLADVPGIYIAQLIVNNGTLNSLPAVATITAASENGLQVSNAVVGPGQSAPLNVTLSSPAPLGGLFVSLASSDTSKATVTAAVIIPAGLMAPTITPRVNGINLGPVTITATAVGVPPATGTVQVTEVLSFSPPSLTITGATRQQLYVFIPGPAPAAGVTLNLSSSVPGVATVPPTVFIGPGYTNTNIPVTGISGGSTVIHASGPNIADTTANVTVNAPVLAGLATIAVVSGSPQSAPISTAFAQPLVVIVKDGSSNPVSGATVTFTPPGSGPSGTFAGGVNTAITNASGIATSAVFTANGMFGAPPYQVTASTPGVSTPAVFNLTNVLGGVASSVTALSGAPQATPINTALGAPLVVVVKDAGGNLESGVTVTFSAPGSGASATFAGGVNTAVTNALGVATSGVLTANGIIGPFSVTASAPGITGSATFSLTNTSLNPADITITDGMMIGQGLQMQGVVILGSPAPAGGVVVSIVADNLTDPNLPNGGPRQIQVSPNATSPGADSTTITIPQGASSGTYYVQAVGTAGGVYYTVNVPGYTSKTAHVTLSSSSFVVATSQGFGQPVFVSLSAYQQNHATTPISVYAARVDPISDAFIVNQQVAGGLTVTLGLTDSNSGAGLVGSPVTITGGSDHTDAQFTPQGLGSTVISVSRHAGNPGATTDGSVTVTVTQ